MTLHVSPDEGFGLQPLEAMASGSLLIATPATAVEELTEGAVVLCVDPRVDSLADAMSRAEHDPGLVEKAKTLNRRRGPRATPGIGPPRRCTRSWST